jgi:hypothetical protein
VIVQEQIDSLSIVFFPVEGLRQGRTRNENHRGRCGQDAKLLYHLNLLFVKTSMN